MIYRDTFTVPSEPIPSFFPTDAPETVAAVMQAPLVLERQPFEYNPFSPTPLDPYRLKIKNGPLYDDSARLYMDAMQHVHMPVFETTEEIEVWRQARLADLHDMGLPTWASVSREMSLQHDMKQARNDQAVDILRGQDDWAVTSQEAEEIMQIRAGVAPLAVMVRFVAAHPEIGGLELMKASRPFDKKAIGVAQATFMRSLHVSNEPDIDVEVVSESHYRRIEIEDPRIVVLKTRLAVVALEGALLEVVMRDSGVIIDPNYDYHSTGYMMISRDGKATAQVAPIAVTAYARLAPR